MSSEPLKVGDVCIVVDCCCQLTKAHFIGRECTLVERAGPDHIVTGCKLCGHVSLVEAWRLDFPEAPKHLRGSHCFPASFLRKRPENGDSAPRTDFTPARQGFVRELLNKVIKKSKEPAA